MALNLLVSFAMAARDDLAAYKAQMPCGRLMVDSGAFTAHNTGRPINLHDYAEYLDTWAHVIDHAITLDVIGDPEATRRNTMKLHGMGHNVMPVFTRGSSVEDFDAMVRDSGYVCVGGAVRMAPKHSIVRLAALQRRALDQGGGIHALGVGAPETLKRIRPYSADSSTVIGGFRFGYVAVYTGGRIIEVRLRHRAKTSTPGMRKHLDMVRQQGIDPGALIRSGNMPRGAEGYALMQKMCVSYLCADEDTVALRVPAPHGVDDIPGCHLYASASGDMAPAAAALDRLSHDPDWSVPMWERYRARHQRRCRAHALVLEETPA